MKKRVVRPALVLAMTWLLVSMVMSILLVPLLGARGLAWLALADLACVFGCGWEIRRAWRIQLAIRDMSDAS
jgi:hypothetical protein